MLERAPPCPVRPFDAMVTSSDFPLSMRVGWVVVRNLRPPEAQSSLLAEATLGYNADAFTSHSTLLERTVQASVELEKSADTMTSCRHFLTTVALSPAEDKGLLSWLRGEPRRKKHKPSGSTSTMYGEISE